jgi:hypothetical protein
MRHIFCQLISVMLLADFMVQPAGFFLLIPHPGRTLLLSPCQRRTRRTVPVATIAMPADHYLPMTPLAVENPAILFCHLVSAYERALQGQAEERCSRMSIDPGAIRRPDVSGGPGCYPGSPPSQTLTRLSHNPVHLATGLTADRPQSETMPTKSFDLGIANEAYG